MPRIHPINAPESEMSEVGTIKMRTPGGKPSSISVSRVAGGQVDIHVSRSSEGEALIRLPASVARQLSEFLAKAGLPSAPEKDETHSCYDDAMFNAGVTHTVELLAKAIDATGWVAGDGSEDYDSDLQQTLMNILIAKGLYDDETGDYAALSQDKRHD